MGTLTRSRSDSRFLVDDTETDRRGLGILLGEDQAAFQIFGGERNFLARRFQLRKRESKIQLQLVVFVWDSPSAGCLMFMFVIHLQLGVYVCDSASAGCFCL